MKKIAIFLLILLNIICILPLPLYTIVREIKSETLDDDEEDNSNILYTDLNHKAEEKIADLEWSNFTHFICNLTVLFDENNATEWEYNRDLLINYGAGAYITPWNGYFVSTHPEGPLKWYVATKDNQELWAPASCILAYEDRNLDSYLNEYPRITTNSIECVYDCSLYLYFSSTKWTRLGHIDVPVYILEEIRDNGYVHVNGGDFIGFDSLGANPIDWWFFDNDINTNLSPYDDPNNHAECPLEYMNYSLKLRVESLYSKQYQAMKEGGKFPWGKVDNIHTLDEQNLIWGSWWYWDGKYGNFLDIDGHDGFGYMDHWVLAFQGLHQCDNNTFYRKLIYNVNESLDSNTIGLFRDGADVSSSEANNYGVRYAFSESGDNSSGLFRLENIPGWWQAHNEVENVWVKFQVFPNDNGVLDDELKIIIASTLQEAQNADFSSSETLIYTRYQKKNIDDDDDSNTNNLFEDLDTLIVVLLTLPIIGVIIVDFIIIKKKKANTIIPDNGV
ncbi:MAG: hypothetical protein ACFFAO_03150 [Candidatus Hermodarchaeota archaeon]